MIATTKNINDSKKNVFNSSKLAAVLREEFDRLKQHYDVTETQLLEALSRNPVSETVPLQIFAQGLGILEALCQHLVDEQGRELRAVANLLNRSYSTITNTLRKARQKPMHEPAEDHGIRIPLTLFQDRSHAPLQALVAYLRDHEQMRFSDIARALDRDPRNINATYREVMRK